MIALLGPAAIDWCAKRIKQVVKREDRTINLVLRTVQNTNINTEAIPRMGTPVSPEKTVSAANGYRSREDFSGSKNATVVKRRPNSTGRIKNRLFAHPPTTIDDGPNAMKSPRRMENWEFRNLERITASRPFAINTEKMRSAISGMAKLPKCVIGHWIIHEKKKVLFSWAQHHSFLTIFGIDEKCRGMSRRLAQ